MEPTLKAVRALERIADSLTADLKERGVPSEACQPVWDAVNAAFDALEAVDRAYDKAWISDSIARSQAAWAKRVAESEAENAARVNTPFQIVTLNGSTYAADAAEVEALGYALDPARIGGDHLRAELRGQPCFTGLCGPQWGGLNESGGPIVRYETWEAYKFYSR